MNLDKYAQCRLRILHLRRKFSEKKLFLRIFYVLKNMKIAHTVLFFISLSYLT